MLVGVGKSRGVRLVVCFFFSIVCMVCHSLRHMCELPAVTGGVQFRAVLCHKHICTWNNVVLYFI